MLNCLADELATRKIHNGPNSTITKKNLKKGIDNETDLVALAKKRTLQPSWQQEREQVGGALGMAV